MKNTQPRSETGVQQGTREFRLIEYNESDHSSGLTLEPVKSRTDFSQLKDEWDQFLAKTQTPSPFLTWDYIDVWWDVYGDRGFTPKLFIARDLEQNIIGAAPLMISERGAFQGARSKFRHLSFIGSLGGAAGESLELPVRRGYEGVFGEAVANHILDELKGQWDVLYLSMVPHDSRATNMMIKKLAEAGIMIKTVSSTASPILPITKSWDDHIAHQEIKVRERIAAAFSNGIQTADHLQLIRVGVELDLETAYEELIRLSKLSDDDAFSRVFETTDMVDFHWKLAPRLIDQGKLFFGLVKINGEYAGAVYDFLDDHKMWARQALWDPKFEQADIKLILNTWSDKVAFDHGLQEIDYLLGNAGREVSETRYTRTLNIYEAACPKSLGGKLFKLACGIDRLLQPNPNN
ncbi:MAG: GNAT family N-acetyltransferase [Akkermansiaceae bacterium]